MKYNVYRKTFTSKRTGDTHYGWSVLEVEPQDTETATFEKVGEVERGDDEGRVALQTRVNQEYGDPTPKGDIEENVLNILSNIFEAKDDYQVYHRSYTSAIDELRRYAEARGYELDDDEMFDTIGMGPAKPKDGKTNKFTVSLTKNGKPQKKALHAQVYGRGPEGYELNMYVL